MTPQEKNRESMRLHRAKKRVLWTSLGLCPRCGYGPPMPKRKLCVKCSAANRKCYAERKKLIAPMDRRISHYVNPSPRIERMMELVEMLGERELDDGGLLLA